MVVIDSSAMDSNDQAKRRINGSLMNQFVGRQVCVLGRASDLDMNGKSFTLTTSDNTPIRVQLQEPVHDSLEEMMVEVHGIPQKNNLIRCNNYVIFSQELSQAYVPGDYDAFVKFAMKHPEHYQVEQ